MFSRLIRLFSTRHLWLVYLILVVLAGLLWWSFSDVENMLGNYGQLHTYTDVGLSIVMIFAFPLLITAILYRSLLFGLSRNLDTKTGVGTAGGIITTIISGSSCCGVTLASYLGLLPLMSLLPYEWLELKLVGTLGLFYALWDILRNLESCKRGKSAESEARESNRK